MMNDREDILWVQQTLGGHPKAFESIVRKYEKTLLNVAFRIVSGREDAEDVVQGTFVKAYTKLSTFKMNLKFFSWLYRIAINEALNLLKEKRRFSELSDDMTSAEKAPDEKLEDRHQAQELQWALRELPFDSRVVLVLRHFMDLSYQEMAAILDIPEKTVKSRLFTARHTLRGKLSKKGIFSG